MADPVATPEAEAVALDTRQAGSLLVEFEDVAGECKVSLERNSEDATGIFRVYHGGNQYAIYTNIPGVCTRQQVNVPEAIEDVLEFAASSSAELSRVPAGAVQCTWVGVFGGNVTISGQAVRLAAPVHACVLTAKYTTLYDRWALPAGWSHYSTALVVARCGDESTSVTLDPDDEQTEEVEEVSEENPAETITFTSDPTTEDEQYYTITVVDYCTGDPIPDARVNTAYGSGTTDGEGKIEIGPVPGGARVDVQVTASGYKNSRTDSLNNEHFVA